LKLDAEKLLSFGVVDEIICEPIGGAHANWDQTAESIKGSLIDSLKKLDLKDSDNRGNRYNKYRAIGAHV